MAMNKKKTEYIDYGIGREYLQHWGVLQALREIYQNFMDFGEYTETVVEVSKRSYKVILRNNYVPDNLEFLRMGTSIKNNPNSIGKYGEGLKMALLIFKRSNLPISIEVSSMKFKPVFRNGLIGETLALAVTESNSLTSGFSMEFNVTKEIFKRFKGNIITKDDVIYSDPWYGQIVSKEKGNIYSGGLYVCSMPKISRAYNIQPRHLELDRDRGVPKHFDLTWITSRINEGYEWNPKDLDSDDFLHVKTVSTEQAKRFFPTLVGSSIEFMSKSNVGESKLLKNSSIRDALMKSPVFVDKIRRLKELSASSMSLDELLEDFKSKHLNTSEALADFEIIQEKIKTKLNK